MPDINNVGIDAFKDGDDYHIVFRNVNEDQIEDIKNIIRAYKGISNEYSEYFSLSQDDIYNTMDNSLGTQHIIPEGKYKGCTVLDAYNYNGHYSLSYLLKTIYKMSSKPKEYIDGLYIETVSFTIPHIIAKEVELTEFVDAYKSFLEKQIEPETLNEILNDTYHDEDDKAYNYLIDNICKRMRASIEKIKGVDH